MKIIFSRKGFDSGSGGVPSPILGGVPVSLPIPSGPSEPFRYADLSHPVAGPLGPIVETASRGRISEARWAHADPVLPDRPGPSALGQQGAAQSHLENQGVGVGDIFVFFGLFRDQEAPRGHPDGRPHHRIFGLMRIERVLRLGPDPDPRDPDLAAWESHPHVHRPGGMENNTLWLGTGCLAHAAHSGLRLTRDDAKGPSGWAAPAWLTNHGLSYHANPARWSPGALDLVARGQEFVSNVGEDREAREWLARIETLLCQAGGLPLQMERHQDTREEHPR